MNHRVGYPIYVSTRREAAQCRALIDAEEILRFGNQDFQQLSKKRQEQSGERNCEAWRIKVITEKERNNQISVKGLCDIFVRIPINDNDIQAFSELLQTISNALIVLIGPKLRLMQCSSNS